MNLTPNVAPHCLHRESENTIMKMKKHLNKSNNNTVKKLHIVTKLHALFSSFHKLEGLLDYDLTMKIVHAMDRWVTCEGAPGLARAKMMSNVFNRRLMGSPVSEFPLSNRYKRLLNKAHARCTNRISSIYWVSVFSTYRLYKTAPVVDVTTITGSFRGRLIGLFKYFKHLKPTKQSFRASIPDVQNWHAKFKWHISGASGPNGSVAYTRYLDDLSALAYNGVGLYCIILFYALPVENRRESKRAIVDAFENVRIRKRDKKKLYHSRLTFLSDKGGKTRVVALGDILSQSLLKVVHQRCNLILRRLKQDGTFDQDQARNYIKKMSKDNVFLASIDLTAATDRFPALFQMWVLIYLRILTPLQAVAWYLVTTCRTFVYFDKNNAKYVRYSVGQPMGLLSSWPVMALTHHFLVRLAYTASGTSPKNFNYRVLGDDLTLRGEEAAKTYLDLIDCLGIDYSPDKTYLSTGRAEFAKSLFILGEDYTPFPTALLEFKFNTIVSNVLGIMSDLKRMNIRTTAQVLLGVFPRRWRNLALLTLLSPSSPTSVLDLSPRTEHWVFLQFLLSQRVAYFSKTSRYFDSVFRFVYRDPGKPGYMASPFYQIAQSNKDGYPVRYSVDRTVLRNPAIILGYGWIAYDPVCWPNGINNLSVRDRTFRPGPTWTRNTDDKVFKYTLLKFNRLVPGYFTPKCVGYQVEGNNAFVHR